MKRKEQFLGCFVSSNMGDKRGEEFRTYIFGETKLSNILKSLKCESYGIDLNFILFQFYVNPIPFEKENLKEIENYRKKEKAIGIPIIINQDNFFNRTIEHRYKFLQETILAKLDLLAVVVKKNKLDTKIELLKKDISELF